MPVADNRSRNVDQYSNAQDSVDEPDCLYNSCAMIECKQIQIRKSFIFCRLHAAGDTASHNRLPQVNPTDTLHR